MARSSAYLQRLSPAEPRRQRLRLFLFPYAGASAAVFRDWPASFDASYELIALQLPGRGSRLAEPALVDFRVLIDEVVLALSEAVRSCRFAFFGHSMGALLAYRVACELARLGLPQPECLFLSGRKAPHLPIERLPVARMSDADFVAELRRLEGTPTALLENAELMQLMLPTVRADFALLDQWHAEAPSCPPQAPLAVPIHALAGRRDPHCTPGDASHWAAYTGASFEILEYNGGHFFIQSHLGSVTADVRDRLDALLSGA